MKFLLIYWLLAPGALVPSTGNATFDDQQSCQDALTALSLQWPSQSGTPGSLPGICVPQSQPPAPAVVPSGPSTSVAPPSAPTSPGGPSKSVAPPKPNS